MTRKTMFNRQKGSVAGAVILAVAIATIALLVSLAVLNRTSEPSTSAYTQPDYTGQKNVQIQDTGELVLNEVSSKVIDGTFADATTTLATFQNPYSATSTVDLAMVKVTGVSTSTISIHVGTSTTAYPSAVTAVSDTLIDGAVVSTSTKAYIVNGANAGPGTGHTSPGTGSMTRIVLGPNEYITFYASDNGGLGGTGGVTNAANTFAGSYAVRITKW